MQSIKLKSTLLAHYYKRKFAALAGADELNTYKVEVTVGAKEDAKMHATISSAAKTAEDLAALGDTHGIVSITLVTRDSAT